MLDSQSENLSVGLNFQTRIAKDFAVILWVVEKNAIERTFGA